jgi:hypothetical protein
MMVLLATERKTRFFLMKPPGGILRSETNRRWTMGLSLPCRLLTFGEEIQGVGFSPGVMKPLAIT